MALLNDNNPITADGDYDTDDIAPGKRINVIIDCTAGTGTIKIQQEDLNGTFRTFLDGEYNANSTTNSRFEINIPGRKTRFNVTSSSSLSALVTAFAEDFQ